MKNKSYSFVRSILKVFTVIFMPPKIEGLENLPKDGGYILAGNHISVFDPFMIGSSTKRPIHYLAKKELFDIPIVGWVLRKIGIIPVDRSLKENPTAKNEALNALNNNEIVCIFPEGTTNKTRKTTILPFKFGAVSFAKKTGKPIVPFAIIGKPHLFNYKIRVIIDKPFYVTDDLEQANKKLEKIVKELIEKMRKKEEHKKLYTFYKSILGVVFKLYYNPKIINKEVIPNDGPIIVCGNHIHLFDQNLPIMASKRMLHYMAKKEYFDDKKVAWFFKSSGCISVNRQIHDKEAKDHALEILKDGYGLGIFPEGTRNKTDKTLLDFKMGTVSMAQKTGATIVPFAITGEYKFRSKNLTCTFLKPFKVGPNDDLEKVNNKLHKMIEDEILKHKKH